MKKKLLGMFVLLAMSASLFNGQLVAQEESPGFNYETKSQFEFRSTSDLCITSTCTRTNGGDCTHPGSAFRDCISLL